MAAKPISDSVRTRKPFLCRWSKEKWQSVFKWSQTPPFISTIQVQKHALKVSSCARTEVETFEGCSLRSLPTLWRREEAEFGSCLLWHRPHSCVETPAGHGAGSPPPAAGSCHLQNSLLRSGASAANGTREKPVNLHVGSSQVINVPKKYSTVSRRKG